MAHLAKCFKPVDEYDSLPTASQPMSQPHASDTCAYDQRAMTGHRDLRSLLRFARPQGLLTVVSEMMDIRFSGLPVDEHRHARHKQSRCRRKPSYTQQRR